MPTKYVSQQKNLLNVREPSLPVGHERAAFDMTSDPVTVPNKRRQYMGGQQCPTAAAARKFVAILHVRWLIRGLPSLLTNPSARDLVHSKP